MTAQKFWTRKNFGPGTVIFNEGDQAREAYLIEKGKVEIYRKQLNGEETLYAVVGENSLFGEIALIDKGVRSASARVVEDTICKVLHERDFDSVLERTDPFLRGLVMLLTARVRRSNEVYNHT